MARIDNAPDKLGPLALSIVALAVIVGVGSIVLTQMEPVSYQTSSLQEEATTLSTPLPDNYTVTQESDADFEKITDDSTTVIFEDSSASTNTTLEEGTSYTVYYDKGKIEVQNTSATTDLESTDNVYVDYKYEQSKTATEGLRTGVDSLSTFSDFFTVIIVIGVAAVLFILLRAVRGAGRSVSA